MLKVLAHGGSASKPEERDGTDAAARAGLREMREGGSPLDAAVRACVVLEDDERFNAGTGSNFLFDGEGIEMDAACMDSEGRFGSVCAIREVKNPVLVARDVLEKTVHCVLAGEGALAFARCMGHDPFDPRTERARKKWEDVVQAIRKGEASQSDCEWEAEPLQSCWNFERDYREILGEPPRRKEGPRQGVCDTVGAVATDGRRFAAAASTGGTITTLRGRIGDTPTIGAGVFAGESGAAACTGNGDHLIRARLASRLHDWMEDGMDAEAAVEKAKGMFPEPIDCCVIVLDAEGRAAAGGNRKFAWSLAEA